MNEVVRRMIAYSAAARVHRKFGSAIYSYDSGQHSLMSKGYDYLSCSHFYGAESGNLYHYGRGNHVSSEVRGRDFSGYDYGSSSHFQGEVRGKSVQIYDHVEGRYFSYSI